MTHRGVGLKRCGGPCGRVRPLGMFYGKKGPGDGYQSYCKDCARRKSSGHYSATRKGRRISISLEPGDLRRLEERAAVRGMRVSKLAAIILSMWVRGVLEERFETGGGAEAKAVKELEVLING